MLRRLKMLLTRLATGPRRRLDQDPNRAALERRHRAVAAKVARVSGRTADSVLVDAYRRADRILASRR